MTGAFYAIGRIAPYVIHCPNMTTLVYTHDLRVRERDTSSVKSLPLAVSRNEIERHQAQHILLLIISMLYFIQRALREQKHTSPVLPPHTHTNRERKRKAESNNTAPAAAPSLFFIFVCLGRSSFLNKMVNVSPSPRGRSLLRSPASPASPASPSPCYRGDGCRSISCHPGE